MIKITDIRIGNKLLLYNEVVKVTEIGFKGDDYYLRIEGKKKGYYIDQFEPIRLNEDILLNCGFEFSHITGDERVFSNKKINILINAYDNNIIKFNVFIIKHLHQLQNIYFALTNEELNYDFNK